jgi:fimbrial chaperone protein
MLALHRVVASGAIALGFALCAAEGARAGGFKFAPAIVQLTAHAHATSVTLTNPGDAPLRVEIAAFRWNQGLDGQALLDETDQLLAFPQLIVIPAGASRQVRLAVLAAPGDREQTYQVAITEIPAFSSPQSRTSAVTIRMRADIPVFFVPAVKRSAGAIAEATVHKSALDFSVANLGSVHFDAKNIHLSGRGADMREVFAQDVSPQLVLAGGRRDSRITLPPTQCASLRALTISLDTDTQHLARSLDVPPGACGP